MIYYHGTSATGLTELIPYKASVSTLHKVTTYFTDGPDMAVLYIQNKPFKWMSFDISNDGFITYMESFPGQLEYFYKGVFGMIYSVSSASIQPTHIQK